MENEKIRLRDWLFVIYMFVMFFVGVYTTTYHIMMWTTTKILNCLETRRIRKKREKETDEEDLEA